MEVAGNSPIEPCCCGQQRRRFWLWKDGSGGVHASRFEPTDGAFRTVLAATARDALLSFSGAPQPKHSVRDDQDPTAHWRGRCSAPAAV